MTGARRLRHGDRVVRRDPARAAPATGASPPSGRSGRARAGTRWPAPATRTCGTAAATRAIPALAALFGDVVHDALDTIVKALVAAGCESAQSPEAVTVLRPAGRVHGGDRARR